MAATLLLWASDEENASNKEPQPPKSNGRISKKSKICGGAPKKQPQRGLGVAQLERLRLQEQKKRHDEASHVQYQYQAPFSLLKPNNACHPQNRVFGHGVGSKPVGSICEHQLPFPQRYMSRSLYGAELKTQPFMYSDDAFQCDNITDLENDKSLRALPPNFYSNRLFNSARKEAGVVGMEFMIQKPSEILPSCTPPLLQGAKLGVPLAVDRSKELSSFQNFQDNWNWCEPGINYKSHPWYAMQQKHNFTAALDLKLAAKERDEGLILLRSSNVSWNYGIGTGPVPCPETAKSCVCGVRRALNTTACADHHAIFVSNYNNTPCCRKRYRNAEECFVTGSERKPDSDFLALTLATSTNIPDSEPQTMEKTDHCRDTVCEVAGCLADQYTTHHEVEIEDSLMGHDASDGNKNIGHLHTNTSLPAFERGDSMEFRSFLDIRSSNDSTSSFGNRASNDAPTSPPPPRPLDLTLKLTT